MFKGDAINFEERACGRDETMVDLTKVCRSRQGSSRKSGSQEAAFPKAKLRREGQGSGEPLNAAAPLLSQNLFPIALPQNSPGTTEKRDSWFVVNVLSFERSTCHRFCDSGMSVPGGKRTGGLNACVAIAFRLDRRRPCCALAQT